VAPALGSTAWLIPRHEYKSGRKINTFFPSLKYNVFSHLFIQRRAIDKAKVWRLVELTITVRSLSALLVSGVRHGRTDRKIQTPYSTSNSSQKALSSTTHVFYSCSVECNGEFSAPSSTEVWIYNLFPLYTLDTAAVHCVSVLEENRNTVEEGRGKGIQS
jgi:hypothetical protein